MLFSWVPYNEKEYILRDNEHNFYCIIRKVKRRFGIWWEVSGYGKHSKKIIKIMFPDILQAEIHALEQTEKIIDETFDTFQAAGLLGKY